MIKIEGLMKKFGEQEIFENFDFEVKEGEMVAITGASGSGKSTLLNIIGSLESFDGGNVFVDKTNVKKLKGSAQRNYLHKTVTFIFQNYALMNDKTVSENIKLIKTKQPSDLKPVLKKVGLENYENKLIFTLSGGEQQRVALARAIHKESKIILADEPTGNLDEGNAQQVIEYLKEFSEQGRTIIVVTHDTANLHYFDRVIKL